MTGIERIAAERQRQIEVEGWTPAHDAAFKKGQLLRAANCYLAEISMPPIAGEIRSVPFLWPWDTKWWKPSADPIRNLEKAGALIAAEIDRLQALIPPPNTEGEK